MDTNHCQEDESGNLQMPPESTMNNKDRFILLSSDDDDQPSEFEIASDSLNVTHRNIFQRKFFSKLANPIN